MIYTAFLVNATRPHWWFVNTCLHNGLVFSGNRLLPEPMSAKLRHLATNAISVYMITYWATRIWYLEFTTAIQNITTPFVQTEMFVQVFCSQLLEIIHFVRRRNESFCWNGCHINRLWVGEGFTFHGNNTNIERRFKFLDTIYLKEHLQLSDFYRDDINGNQSQSITSNHLLYEVRVSDWC